MRARALSHSLPIASPCRDPPRPGAESREIARSHLAASVVPAGPRRPPRVFARKSGGKGRGARGSSAKPPIEGVPILRARRSQLRARRRDSDFAHERDDGLPTEGSDRESPRVHVGTDPTARPVSRIYDDLRGGERRAGLHAGDGGGLTSPE